MKKITSMLFVIVLISFNFLIVTSFVCNNVRGEIWSIETIDDAGYVGASIALDNNDNPHISYYDSINEDLMYVKWTGSTWDIQTVDSPGIVGRFASIALDDNDYPHISYSETAPHNLKYARWTGTEWDIQTVDSPNVGYFISIALDSNNYPHISYSEIGPTSLKYARWTGSDWSIYTVDSLDEVGYYTSLALDSFDRPHISYYDTNRTNLRYARWNDISWDIQTVDSDGDVGWDTSIAIDSADFPHISYYDKDNMDLKYTRWDGSSWDIQTVDSDGWVGRATSLALDSNDYPHISYWDWDLSTYDVKYAKWDGSSWNIQMVDSEDWVGVYTSLELDSNGYAHICYYDDTNDKLKYAKAEQSTIPGAPQNFHATPGNNLVVLDWTAPVSDGGSIITNYSIYRGMSPNGEIFLATVGSVLTFNDTSVINGQTYYYKISAINSVGEGPLSNETSVTPQASPTVPSMPLNLKGEPDDQKIILSWSPPSTDGGSNITGYKIYRGTSPGGGTLLTTIGNVLTYNDTSVTNGQVYYYKVSAVNGVGEGMQSDEVSATPTTGATVPSAPLNILANAGDTYVNLTWNVPSDDGGSVITNYKIYRGTSSDGETLLTTIINVLYYNDTDVANLQIYYYKVSAVNGVGDGSMSNEVSATPNVTPISNDSDQDGLLDDWELQYFGNLSQSGGEDFDGDGYNNTQEHDEDTDPTDSESHPPPSQDFSILDYWWIILIILIGLIAVAIAIFFQRRKSLPPSE